MMKKCSSCGIEKDEALFNKDKRSKDGLFSQCKECRQKYRIKCKKEISEYNKQYNFEHKEERKERDKINSKAYYIKNKKEMNEKSRQYEINNKEKMKAARKLYAIEHKKELNEHIRKRKTEDVEYKLKCSLRTRLSMVIKGKTKSGSAVDDLGCSIPELRKHLEAQFRHDTKTGEMMTWDNYGKKGWHIDHIKPLAKFNLEDREQLLKACHYTNLQPLWWWENLEKNDKYEEAEAVK